MRRRALLLAPLAAPLLAPGFVRAQGEARAIRWVVPYPPGGPADVVARIAALKLGEELGLPLVVENRAGGNGTIGTELVRQAAADGSTLLAAPSVHAMARLVLRAVPFDPVTDFTPVARTAEAPLLVLANPALGVRSIGELLPKLRAAPERFSFGLSALGAAAHLAVLQFNRLAGLDLLVVPYRGSAPALTDLIGGRVQLMIDPIPTALPHVRDGRLVALAVTSPRRAGAAPEVPTAAESGMPGLEVFSWYGVWGPAGLPAVTVARLNAALNAGMQQPDTARRLAPLGIEPVAESAAAFRQYIADDVARSAALLRAANFQPE